MKGTDKEFIVDKAKFREKLEEENTGDAKVADVLEAFDLFFESHEAKKKIIKQSEFSALLRENELKLLGNTFQVVDLEDEPLSTQNAESAALLTKQQPVESQENVGGLNIAKQSIAVLQENSQRPQIRI